MNNRKYTVYKLTFPDEMVYIGLTSQTVNERWGYNGSGYKFQSTVGPYISKYDWEDVKKEIIETDLSVNDGMILEKKMIEENKDHCLNDKGGGELGSIRKDFMFDNQLYTAEEIAEMSETNITPHDVTTRIGRGWDLDKIINQNKQPRTYAYEYDGELVSIDDLYDLCEVENLSRKQFTNRLRSGWDVDRAITQSTDTKKQPFGVGKRKYEYNGKMYNSYELSQINPELGLTSSEISNRINHHGWSIEKAISKPKKKMNLVFEYDGKQYDSHQLAKICLDDTMTYHDVTDRNRAGWTPWEIVNIPKNITRKQYYANPKPSLSNLNNVDKKVQRSEIEE